MNFILRILVHFIHMMTRKTYQIFLFQIKIIKFKRKMIGRLNYKNMNSGMFEIQEIITKNNLFHKLKNSIETMIHKASLKKFRN